jgi:serine/threonine protein kinase
MMAHNLIGTTMGRFHIVESLGAGGMAAVYKAYDNRLDRTVAIKVIRSEKVDEKFLQRFDLEAKALAKLQHPNIVHILDYGEQDGMPYLVMDYLSGGTLKKLMGKAMDWSEAAALLAPIARALQHAHSKNIVHRDVKPANILITAAGIPMLSDFGIAKLLDPGNASGLTDTGVGIGTPDYMAPEQCVGKPVPQTDIYSLGVVFYEMVTGQRPYKADTPAAVMFKHVSDPLPKPSLIVPNLPENIENIIFKALEKNLENRFKTMADFATALEKIAQSVPFSVDPPLSGKPSAYESQTTLDWVGASSRHAAVSTPRRHISNIALVAGLCLAALLAGIFLGPGLLSKIKTASAPLPTPFPTPSTDYSIGAVLFKENFESSLSSRWNFQPADWPLETIEGRKVIHNVPVAANEFNQVSSAEIVENSWNNYVVQFDFKFLKPDSYGSYSLTVRTEITNCPPTVQSRNCYFMTFTPDKSEFKRESCDREGNPLLLSASDIDFDAKQWHMMQIFHFNGRVQVFIDGMEYFNVVDSNPFSGGGFVIETFPLTEFVIAQLQVNEVIP